MRPRMPTRAQVESATVIRPDQLYQLVRYRQPVTNGSGVNVLPPFPIKKVEVSGDHLSVFQVNGQHAVYCKFGSFRNPWVRINPRTVYKRSFRALWFTLGDTASGNVGAGLGSVNVAKFVEVVAYASVGPFAEFTSVVPGVKRGFLPIQVTITAYPAAVDLINSMTAPSNDTRVNTAGIEGGMLFLRNIGAFPIDLFSNSFIGGLGLGFRMGVAPDPSSMLQIPLVGALGETMNSGAAGAADCSLYAAGIGGASAVAVLLSPWEQDATIPEHTPQVSLGG